MQVMIRQLEKKDLYNGFLESLDSLRRVSDLSKEKAEHVFNAINSNPNHIIHVAEYEGKIITCAYPGIDLFKVRPIYKDLPPFSDDFKSSNLGPELLAFLELIEKELNTG